MGTDGIRPSQPISATNVRLVFEGKLNSTSFSPTNFEDAPPGQLMYVLCTKA